MSDSRVQSGQASQPEPLPSDAVVVRGGVMTAHNIASAFETAFRDSGAFDLSVEAASGLSADEIVRWVREHDPDCTRLPHNKLQESTVGAVRAAAAEVILSEPPDRHYAIRFRTRPTDDDIKKLMAVFGEPKENPVSRKNCLG